MISKRRVEEERVMLSKSKNGVSSSPFNPSPSQSSTSDNQGFFNASSTVARFFGSYSSKLLNKLIAAAGPFGNILSKPF